MHSVIAHSPWGLLFKPSLSMHVNWITSFDFFQWHWNYEIICRLNTLLLRFRGQRGKHVTVSSEFYTAADRIACTKQFARHVKRNIKVNFPEYSGDYWFAKAFDVFDVNLMYVCLCIVVYG